ncbi:MAG: glycoside hydrolase family 95 protein [Bacteroidales bacterium]|nr:glycoside hydrolase family 95 protein [Bacteroidales bacterium]
MSLLIASLIVSPCHALADDNYRHSSVALQGGALNYWNTSYPFTYQGENIWTLIITLPVANGQYTDVEPRVNGSTDWKITSSATMSVGTPYDIVPSNGADLQLDSSHFGNTYKVTIAFTSESTGSMVWEEYVETTTVNYYILDGKRKELTSNIIKINSEYTDHTIYFCQETTVSGATTTTTTTYYGFPSGTSMTNEELSTTLTKDSTNALTLPGGDYTYTINVGDLTDLPDSPSVTVTRTAAVPYVTAIYLNGTEYTDGQYYFAAGATLAFTAQLSNGSVVSYDSSENISLTAGSYTLFPNGTGTITLPADATDYIYTLSLTRNADDSEWILIVTTQIDPDKEKKAALSSTLTNAIISGLGSTYTPEDPLTIWFTDNSTNNSSAPIQAYGDCYTHSFCLGNGKMGVSWFGTTTDKILINDKTYFLGTRDENYDLPGQVAEANGPNFCPLGYILMAQTGASNPSQIRELNLTNGVSTVLAVENDVTISKEMLVSLDEDAMVMRLTSYPANGLNFTFQLGDYSATGVSSGYSVENSVAIASYSQSKTYSTETYPFGSNLTFEVYQSGGNLSTSDGKVTVTGASEIYVVCVGVTDYDMEKDHFLSGETADQLESRAKTAASLVMTKLQNGGWESIYNAHVAEFSTGMNASTLTLSGAKNTQTADAIKSAYDAIGYTSTAANASATTRMGDMLLYAMGRYMHWSSSRGSTDLPSNLQGIWASDNAPWGCDYHANINLQMNYWNAEPTNLSSSHMPFLNYQKIMAQKRWGGYANKLVSGTGGWTIHLLNTPYGGVGTYNGNYVEAAAWNCSHIWQHYLYTLDYNFLKEFFPTIWGATKFYLGYLKKDDMCTSNSDHYIIPNTYSPENNGGGGYAVHAQQLVYEHLRYTLEAASILGSDAGLTSDEISKLETYLTNMDTGLHPQNGLLQEWIGVSPSSSDTHRHLSHLMCLYPLAQVSPYDKDLTNFNAAYGSLLVRGDTDGGENAAWNTAHKMTCYARARKGDLAMRQLAYGMSARFAPTFRSLNKINIFQIEGGAGVSAAMAEMLAQGIRGVFSGDNQYGFIDVAPALPATSWPTGQVTGLKTQGNYQVDLKWEDGIVQEIKITACADSPLPFYVCYDKAMGDATNGVYLVDTQYSVSERSSGLTRVDMTSAEIAAITDGAYTWKFQPSAKGDYVVITRGNTDDPIVVEPDPEPDSVIVLFEADDKEIVPNDGCKIKDTDGNVVAVMMFGAKDVPVLKNDTSFERTVMKWNPATLNYDETHNESVDNYYSPTIGAAEPTIDAEDPTTDSWVAYTEVNGFASNSNAKDGGLFLAPVGGNFLRFEPMNKGILKVWVSCANTTSTDAVYVLDEFGRRQTFERTIQNQRMCITIDVKAGKSYYVAPYNDMIGFVAMEYDYVATDKEVTIDETSTLPPMKDDETYSVTLGRTFTPGYWHPIVLPFSVSESMMRKVFGENVAVLYCDPFYNSKSDDSSADYYSSMKPAVEDSRLAFTRHHYQMLLANVPAFICPSEPITNPVVLSNVTYENGSSHAMDQFIYGSDGVASYKIGGGYVINGSLSPRTLTGEVYYISNSGGTDNVASVYHSNQGVNFKGMRAWIEPAANATNPVPLRTVAFNQFDDSESAALHDILSDELTLSRDENVYDITGRIVGNGSLQGLAPGIYIYRGQKIAIK